MPLIWRQKPITISIEDLDRVTDGDHLQLEEAFFLLDAIYDPELLDVRALDRREEELTVGCEELMDAALCPEDSLVARDLLLHQLEVGYIMNDLHVLIER